MNPNRPITNPMLCGTIELLKAEDTPEHRSMFMDELIKARFLAPVMIDPAPQADENGIVKMDASSKVHFPMLPTKDGMKFFMAFTDVDELKKANMPKDQQIMVFTIDDYANLLSRKYEDGENTPVVGFVINPFGSSIAVNKPMLAKYMAAQLAKKGIVIQTPEMQAAATEENESED